jgi:ABC-2 type transport system permease protein
MSSTVITSVRNAGAGPLARARNLPHVVAKTTWVELKLFFRDPAAAFFTLALPVLLLVLNGAGGNDPNPRFGGAGAIDVLVPGYIALVIATLGLMQLPAVLAGYRERGVLRRLEATPIRPGVILVAQLLVQGLIATVGLVVLVALGMTVFDLRAPQAPWTVLAAYVVAVMGFSAFGFVLAAVLPTARSTTAVAAALYFPMIFLSGATWPREVLPDWAARAGDVLPLTYVVESVKRPWITGDADLVAMALLAAMIVVGTAIASRLFRWA